MINDSPNICREDVHLDDKLSASGLLFKEQIDSDHWVVFDPSNQGWPVVIKKKTMRVLEQFSKEKKVSDLLSDPIRSESDLANIFFLLRNGYLKRDGAYLPYCLQNDYEFEPPRHVEVWLHLTNICNLKCRYCFVEDKRPITMSYNVLKKVANSLAFTSKKYNLKKLTIKFAGGEPTLVYPIIEKFKAVIEELMTDNSTELHFSLLSNGTILNERILHILKDPNTRLSISIDGYESAHNTFRIFKKDGTGSWATIQRNLALLREHDINPYITSTISSETSDSLSELIDWIRQCGLSTRINLVRQSDCSWENSADTLLKYSNVCDRVAESFARAFRALESPSYSLDFVKQLRIADLHFFQPAFGQICGIGHNHIVVKPDGHVVSCPMSTEDKGIWPGNDLLFATKKSFPWTMFERMQKPDDDECLSCLWFPVCSSGCPITNLRINGHPFSKSPFCELYKIVIPSYIRLFAKK
ncbi:MAG: radical SAM protein, partial [Desulfosarcinaceae bacterium]|nr:radical SAM protein [Desulfosarcinaceae bacterium]